MKKLVLFAAVAVALSLSAPVFAHHGDAGRYDENLVTLNGSIVELQMINPHSIIVVDVPDANGKSTRWQAEMGGPNALARGFGWTRNTLKPGDKVTIIGRRVKSGAPYMNLSFHALVDFGWSSPSDPASFLGLGDHHPSTRGFSLVGTSSSLS